MTNELTPLPSLVDPTFALCRDVGRQGDHVDPVNPHHVAGLQVADVKVQGPTVGRQAFVRGQGDSNSSPAARPTPDERGVVYLEHGIGREAAVAVGRED